MTVGIASYGNILATSDCLIEEWGLFCALAKDLEMTPAQALRCVPWRRKLLKREGVNTFCRPSGRYAGIGMAACTCFEKPERPPSNRISPCFIMGFRSSQVSTYIQKSHVAPAGMCNTKQLKNEEDYFLINISSEFLEEIFNLDQYDKMTGADWRDRVRTEMRGLADRAGLRMGVNWDVQLTGICFDLMNLRPEVCVLIRFTDDKFWNEFRNTIKPNYEYEGEFEYPRKQAEQGMRMSETMQQDLVDHFPRPIGRRWVQSGAVSFMLGSERVYGKQRRI